MSQVTRLAHHRYGELLARESDLFLAALREADPHARVPTCPDWDVDDLLFHLSEVQDFWSILASGRAGSPEEAETLKSERAATHDDLVSHYESASATLRLAVGRDPATACWTWYDPEQTVGWVARRQAHEALIHRVDAQLAADRPVTDADPELAADGIDEMLRVMCGGIPAWGDYRRDGGTVAVETTDTGHRWTAEVGSLWGTSPNTGTTYEGLPMAEAVDEPAASPDATVRGPAFDVDRWLWGRGDLEVLHVVGDVGAARRLRDACEVQ